MRITFDPAKRAVMLAKRGLDFVDSAMVFEGSSITREEVRFAYPERRFITAGELGGRMVVLVWTPVEDGRRIISMRYAHEREARKWRGALDRP